MAASAGRSTTPVLAGAALDAVRHRGGHLQIIAAAGSGKTEVVSQRIADLLADGFAAESIVAFTFTERAAEELKNRIARRVEDRLGDHNGADYPAPYTNVDDFLEQLAAEIRRNYTQYFGPASP
jgi:superfamily I DNA/RNA helicase